MCVSILLACATNFAWVIECCSTTTTIVNIVLLCLDKFINDFVFTSKINLNHLEFGPEARILTFKTIGGETLLNHILVQPLSFLLDDSRMTNFFSQLLQFNINLSWYLDGARIYEVFRRRSAFLHRRLPLVEIDLANWRIWCNSQFASILSLMLIHVNEMLLNWKKLRSGLINTLFL